MSETTTAAVAPAVAPFAGARLAIAFLTIVPTGRVEGLGAAWLSRAAPWFPVVGALVGGVAAGACALADAAGVSPAVAGALAIVAAIVFTRGLHEDGLADTADGLGVHGTRERRLAAMKDSAVGAHGALAMACALLVAALALAALDAAHAARALVAAHVASRAAMVVAAAALPNARAGAGLGRSLAVAPRAAVVATALAAATFVVAGAPAALGAAAVALLAALAVQVRAFGGRTGDTLGATGKVVEVAVLVALSGAWS
ncbi:Adenosylcobinamide-GDP ribazoletransferase [Baekduia alba]|uniref:adenosylcobinamide-GDP ribazoletransferase n=1 Tax=Baekduia alba TaxID=2997333 RepID=UPI00234206EC|nr:adenosylcobinamide-GDP ribazoletransferase [Baekduia alba]WCB93006.1 Adenosylcobinamide-GDP ribazoletransferase [Baekduia alba]